MESPERPTEAQILDWLRLYVPEEGEPVWFGAGPADLPRSARILWLRYCAEPPLSVQAIAEACGLSYKSTSDWALRGLALLVSMEERGVLPGSWNPESPLGRAVILWRLQHRPFVPRTLRPEPC